MSRRKLRAAPALRAYIKRFAPKPAAPKAPPVDNPYHRFLRRIEVWKSWRDRI